MQEAFTDVLRFLTRHGRTFPDTPSIPDPQTAQLQWDLVDEEINYELEPALTRGSLPQIADAIADSIYVLCNMAAAYGIDLPAVWKEVQSSNMTKTPGLYREDGKILKGPTYSAPQIAKVLASQPPIHHYLQDGEPK